MKKALFVLAVLVLFCTACQKQEESIHVKIGPENVIDESGTPMETPAEETQVEETSAETDEAMTNEEIEETSDETEDAMEETSDEMTETDVADSGLNEITCDEKQTIGYMGCADMDSYAELSIKNAGRIDLSGVYIRYLDSDDNILDQDTEKFEFVVGDSKVLNLSMMGNLEKINIYPTSNRDVCINKPTVIIPKTNCR